MNKNFKYHMQYTELCRENIYTPYNNNKMVINIIALILSYYRFPNYLCLVSLSYGHLQQLYTQIYYVFIQFKYQFVITTECSRTKYHQFGFIVSPTDE